MERDVGFVLRTWPLRETDLIVSFFARDHGRIRGVAHGARRPKGRWAGALEPLCEIEVQWRAREGEELHSFSGEPSIVRSPYQRFPGLEVAWTLAFVAELVDETAPAHDADATLYRLVHACLDALAEGATPRVVARYAEAWVLRLHGVLPETDACAGCGAPLAREGGSWAWELHGLACPSCARGRAEPGPVLLPEDLRFLDQARRRPPAGMEAPSPATLRRLGAFLGRLLSEFLGRELRSERFLAELDD